LSKLINARVAESVAAELESVAEYEGVAVAHLVREAVIQLVESRKVDPAFKRRVIESMERSRRLLNELGVRDEAAEYDLHGSSDASGPTASRSAPVAPSNGGRARAQKEHGSPTRG
jgi:hypothetical protein